MAGCSSQQLVKPSALQHHNLYFLCFSSICGKHSGKAPPLPVMTLACDFLPPCGVLPRKGDKGTPTFFKRSRLQSYECHVHSQHNEILLVSIIIRGLRPNYPLYSSSILTMLGLKRTRASCCLVNIYVRRP